MTGLGPFSLSAGTAYRLCICSSSGEGGYKAARPSLAADATRVAAYLNTIVTHQGEAANVCTSGTPPATTGSLTAGTGAAPWVRIRP
jgi:hypothetical protein